MSTQLVTLSEDETISLAEQLMQAIRVRHLPVLAAGDRLIGLVSDRDLMKAAASSLAKLSEEDDRAFKRSISVGEIMTRDLCVVTPDTTILDACKQMRGRKIGCLPVVDGDELVGVLTETDLIDVLIGALDTSGSHEGARAEPGLN
jgi:CBS domain-containing protein